MADPILNPNHTVNNPAMTHTAAPTPTGGGASASSSKKEAIEHKGKVVGDLRHNGHGGNGGKVEIKHQVKWNHSENSSAYIEGSSECKFTNGSSLDPNKEALRPGEYTGSEKRACAIIKKAVVGYQNGIWSVEAGAMDIVREDATAAGNPGDYAKGAASHLRNPTTKSTKRPPFTSKTGEGVKASVGEHDKDKKSAYQISVSGGHIPDEHNVTQIKRPGKEDEYFYPLDGRDGRGNIVTLAAAYGTGNEKFEIAVNGSVSAFFPNDGERVMYYYGAAAAEVPNFLEIGTLEFAIDYARNGDTTSLRVIAAQNVYETDHMSIGIFGSLSSVNRDGSQTTVPVNGTCIDSSATRPFEAPGNAVDCGGDGPDDEERTGNSRTYAEPDTPANPDSPASTKKIPTQSEVLQAGGLLTITPTKNFKIEVAIAAEQVDDPYLTALGGAGNGTHATGAVGFKLKW